MRKPHTLLWLLLLMALAANPAWAAVRYNLTDLGTLPGNDASWAGSINNHGQIVGYAATAGEHIQAVLFDPTGGGDNIDLGTLGGEHGNAYSINDLGQIVGWADCNDPDLSPHATIFDPNNAASNISLANESAAYSANDHGQIVGYRLLRPQDGSEPIERASLFDPYHEPNSIDLGTLPGYRGSVALSINNNGYIVGFSRTDMFAQDFRATRFDPNGTGNNIDLGTLGGDTSLAFSINEIGQVVGSADTAGGYRRAALFHSTGAGSNIDLGTMPGYNESVAFSINNCGQIVGQFYVDPLRNDHRAMLFDRTGRSNNIDLNDLIDPALGWILRTTMCINDNGWIVGSGINLQGENRAFLLKPAAPGDFEPDRDVDLKDFALLAAAWRSRHGDESYNPLCDLAEPKDYFIDERDLVVFAENYLTEPL